MKTLRTLHASHYALVSDMSIKEWSLRRTARGVTESRCRLAWIVSPLLVSGIPWCCCEDSAKGLEEGSSQWRARGFHGSGLPTPSWSQLTPSFGGHFFRRKWGHEINEQSNGESRVSPMKAFLVAYDQAMIVFVFARSHLMKCSAEKTVRAQNQHTKLEQD